MNAPDGKWASRRGAQRLLDELEREFHALFDATIAEPKPCRWAKSADEVRASAKRFNLCTPYADSGSAPMMQSNPKSLRT